MSVKLLLNNLCVPDTLEKECKKKLEINKVKDPDPALDAQKTLKVRIRKLHINVKRSMIY